MKFKTMRAKRYYARRNKLRSAVIKASRHARSIPEQVPLANKLLSALHCTPGKPCRNITFCDGCMSQRKHRYSQQILNYGKPLYAYLRREVCLLEDLSKAGETLSLMKKHRAKLIAALKHRYQGGIEKGIADMRGAIHRFEILPEQDKWKVMLTSLLLFPSSAVHSMSPFWAEHVKYAENHTASIRCLGRVSSSTYLAEVMNRTFMCRPTTYANMDAEDLATVCQILNGTHVFEATGKVFRNHTFEKKSKVR